MMTLCQCVRGLKNFQTSCLDEADVQWATDLEEHIVSLIDERSKQRDKLRRRNMQVKELRKALKEANETIMKPLSIEQ